MANSHTENIDIELFKDDLEYIDQDFLQSIIQIFSFTYEDEKQFLLMTEKATYAYGEVICSWLSLKNKLTKPQRISLLNDIKIVQVDSGCDFVAILTDDGRVYLSSNDSHWKTNKKLRSINTGNDFFKMIACGKNHLLMLRQDDHVFAMGDNCCDKITGNETSSCESMINTGIENVKLIACGQFHSIVVTNSSEIYSWGDNFFGQLGLGDQNDRNTPCLVTFPNDDSVDTRIKDIVAGSKHSLFLLENGQLWGCGSNYDGELGLGYDIGPTKLTKLPFEKNLQQIACSKDHNLSLAHDGLIYYYAWGKIMNDTWTSPRKLYDQHSSFASASALLLESQTTFGLTSVTNLCESNYTSAIQSIRRLFDNPNNYDVEFIIKKRRIKVSKCYLKSVSKFYDDKFLGDWNEKKEVTISDYSYDAYYEYLHMLHMGQIRINHQNITEFISLAYSHGDEKFIKQSELLAIFSAAEWVVSQRHSATIASDSQSAIKAIECRDSSNALAIKIRKILQSSKQHMEGRMLQGTNIPHYDTYYAYLRMLHDGTIRINPQNIAELIDLANCYRDQ
ncbi:RCC1 and BTB domain-containing protein 1-like [Dermatophagoides farinae]|uniref:RCC1 and BTB domain-containing protein 1-like n=1 Tax=Dermatophagoides farinae TaxID=6954 RepID=UPI003F638308